MICTDCKTPMVTIRQASRDGVPEGHRRHMGHGRCSACIKPYRAAHAPDPETTEDTQEFNPDEARADLVAWLRARRDRLGISQDLPLAGLDSHPLTG